VFGVVEGVGVSVACRGAAVGVWGGGRGTEGGGGGGGGGDASTHSA